MSFRSPLNAADIGAAVGASVPTAAAIGAATGAAVPVPPSAASIGAATGAAVPSAAAIGGATSDGTLAKGVPNVLLNTLLVDGGSIASGGNLTVDISKQASVVISIDDLQNGVTQLARISQSVAGAASVTVEVETVAFPARIISILPGFTYPTRISLKCLGTTLTIVNNSAGTMSNVKIVGSNRDIARFVDARYNVANVDVWTRTSGALTAGTTYDITHATDSHLQDECFARFSLTAATAARGYFQVLDAAGSFIVVATTDEFATTASGYQTSKRVILPATYQKLQFVCTTAGTTAVRAELASLST